MSNALDSAAKRLQIAQSVITKFGTRRAAQGLQPAHPPEAPKHGWDGVDIADKGGRTYRARIRFCEASTGKDVRINQRGFADAADAGYWHMCAHIRAWGALSRYAEEIDPEVLAFLADGADTSVRDNLRGLSLDHPHN